MYIHSKLIKSLLMITYQDFKDIISQLAYVPVLCTDGGLLLLQ